MGASEWVHLDVQVIRQETQKGFQVILESGKIYWLAKSAVANQERYQAGDRNCTVSVKEWFWEKKLEEEKADADQKDR